MGDMADYYNELQEEDGRCFPAPYYPPRQKGSTYAQAYGSVSPKCRYCGAACKWRTNDSGKWQLFNLSREGSLGNRDIPHSCASAADDFDDLTGE